MARIPKDYMEKVYAGWLGKIIGVRHGAPIEGWEYDRIKGCMEKLIVTWWIIRILLPMMIAMGQCFLRALEDYTHTPDITAEQIGLTWLNYAPYEHGFYWWGGYGNQRSIQPI